MSSVHRQTSQRAPAHLSIGLPRLPSGPGGLRYFEHPSHSHVSPLMYPPLMQSSSVRWHSSQSKPPQGAVQFSQRQCSALNWPSFLQSLALYMHVSHSSPFQGSSHLTQLQSSSSPLVMFGFGSLPWMQSAGPMVHNSLQKVPLPLKPGLHVQLCTSPTALDGLLGKALLPYSGLGICLPFLSKGGPK